MVIEIHNISSEEKVLKNSILRMLKIKKEPTKETYIKKITETLLSIENLLKGKTKDEKEQTIDLITLFVTCVYYIPYLIFYFSILFINNNQIFKTICYIQIAITFIVLILSYNLLESFKKCDYDIKIVIEQHKTNYNFMFCFMIIKEIAEYVFLYMLITKIILHI